MNYGSVRLAKSQLPNRERYDGNVRQDDWGFPLNIFICSSRQRRLLLFLSVPESCESPAGAGASLPEEHLLCRGTVAMPPRLFGVPAQLEGPRCRALLDAVTACHHWKVLACSEAQHLQREWQPLLNLVFPEEAVEGGSDAGVVKDHGSNFADDPLSHLEKITSRHRLSVPLSVKWR